MFTLTAAQWQWLISGVDWQRLNAASPLAGLKDALNALTKSGYNALFSGISALLDDIMTARILALNGPVSNPIPPSRAGFRGRFRTCWIRRKKTPAKPAA